MIFSHGLFCSPNFRVDTMLSRSYRLKTALFREPRFLAYVFPEKYGDPATIIISGPEVPFVGLATVQRVGCEHDIIRAIVPSQWRRSRIVPRSLVLVGERCAF